MKQTKVLLERLNGDWKTSEHLVCERQKAKQNKIKSLFIRVF